MNFKVVFKAKYPAIQAGYFTEGGHPPDPAGTYRYGL